MKRWQLAITLGAASAVVLSGCAIEADGPDAFTGDPTELGTLSTAGAVEVEADQDTDRELGGGDLSPVIKTTPVAKKKGDDDGEPDPEPWHDGGGNGNNSDD